MNGQYAIRAAKALQASPSLQFDRVDLWRKSCLDNQKAHNGQMDVVVALSQAGLLNQGARADR